MIKKRNNTFGNVSNAPFAKAKGYATETTNFGEAAFGILNKSTRDKSNFTTPEVVSSSTATLFSVGNGSNGIRKNIIELKADGTVLISGVGGYDGTNPDDATGIADKMQGIEGSVDGFEEAIDSINIVKDETNDLVYTLMVDGEERGSINIPKDQFLKSVTYNEETNELIFTFVTSESDNQEVRVNMTDLVDTYTAGDGLSLENKQFSVKVDADTQPYIEVSSNGVKVIGIDEKFNTVNLNVTDLTNRVTTAESDIDAILDELANLEGSGEGSVQDQINNALEGYLPLSGGTLTGSITFESEPVGNVGDAVLYDKQANKLIVVPTTDDMGTQYPADDYEPIGVVVIPAFHNVYGDGSCGVMSLKNMSVDTPDTGQIQHEGMFYGQININSSLPNLTDAPYVGNGYNYGDSNSTVIGNVDIQEYICYIPSDAFNTVLCPHDVTAYYYVTRDINYYAPSPYLTDGSRNPAYYQTTSPSSTSNALADFDGAGNTTTYLDLATAQSDWKTSSSILQGSSVEDGYSPAACCCWRYHTSGTQQGDWYLPACGELGYVIAKLKTINDAISKLISVYGSSFAVALFASKHYWSSTEGNYAQTFAIPCDNGRIDSHNRFANNLVRAFTRILPESNSFGIIVSGKSDQDLLNAAGGTTSISDILAEVPSPDLSSYATKSELPTVQSGQSGTTSNYVYSSAADEGYRVLSDISCTRTGDVVKLQGRTWGMASNSSLDLVTLPLASSSMAGLMSTTDKSKLDQITITDGDIVASGFRINDGTANEVLTANGDSNTLKTINGQTLLGNGDVDMSEFATQEDITELLTAIGSNTYEGSNYLTKETNLTDAVLQLDEEIKAANDNIDLEHTNAEATYAKKTQLDNYLPLSGGTLTGKIYGSIGVFAGFTITESLILDNYLISTNSSNALDIIYTGENELDEDIITLRASEKLVTIGKSGIQFNGKTNQDLLHAAGGTVSIQDIISQVPAPDLSSKQDVLVSGTNIKTIGGETILGSGNFDIATESDITALFN